MTYNRWLTSIRNSPDEAFLTYGWATDHVQRYLIENRDIAKDRIKQVGLLGCHCTLCQYATALNMLGHTNPWQYVKFEAYLYETNNASLNDVNYYVHQYTCKSIDFRYMNISSTHITFLWSRIPGITRTEYSRATRHCMCPRCKLVLVIEAIGVNVQYNIERLTIQCTRDIPTIQEINLNNVGYCTYCSQHHSIDYYQHCNRCSQHMNSNTYFHCAHCGRHRAISTAVRVSASVMYCNTCVQSNELTSTMHCSVCDRYHIVVNGRFSTNADLQRNTPYETAIHWEDASDCGDYDTHRVDCLDEYPLVSQNETIRERTCGFCFNMGYSQVRSQPIDGWLSRPEEFAESTALSCYRCRFIWPQSSMMVIGGRWQCNRCTYNRIYNGQADDSPRRAINNYSYRPEFVVHMLDNERKPFYKAAITLNKRTKSTPLFMGMELEVEMKNKFYAHRDRTAKAFSDNVDPNIAFLKSDGSIHQGFEIVTHPATIDWWQMENNPFFAALSEYVIPKCKSYHTTTCGIHIHMNRSAFTAYHLAKFIKFFYSNKTFVCQLAERNPNSYANFEIAGGAAIAHKANIRTLSFKREKENKTKYSFKTVGNKYDAINLCHPDTVEIRIFRGNLKIERIMKNFQFLQAVFDYTKEAPLSGLGYMGHVPFTVWLNKKSPKEYNQLRAFIKNRVDVPVEEADEGEALTAEQLAVTV